MRRILASLLITAIVSLAWVPRVSASTHFIATGTFHHTSGTILAVRVASGTTFITARNTGVLAGDIVGTQVSVFTVALRADGHVTAHGREICTCTIFGPEGSRSGTYVDAFTFHGMLSDFVGHATIIDATGEHEGLQGEGTFAGGDLGGGIGGTYTYSLHYEH